jgi:hypothetical protein
MILDIKGTWEEHGRNGEKHGRNMVGTREEERSRVGARLE